MPRDPHATDWRLLAALALSGALHAGMAVATLRVAGSYAGRTTPGAPDANLVMDDARAPLPSTPPPPPPEVQQPPPEPQAQPEPPPPQITLGRDDSNAVTATWVGVAPKDATEASGRAAAIDQAAFALPTGAEQPSPGSVAQGAPGEQSKPSPSAPVALVPSKTPTPAEMKPSPAPQDTPSPSAAAPVPPPREGAPDAKDDKPQEKKDQSELLREMQKRVDEMSSLLADLRADADKNAQPGNPDGTAPKAEPDAKDDKKQDKQDEQKELTPKERLAPGDIPDAADPLNPDFAQDKKPTEQRDKKNPAKPAPADEPKPDAPQDPASPQPPDAPTLEMTGTPELPSPAQTPPTPQTISQAPVPQGIVPDSTDGEQSDRESTAAAIKGAIRAEPGKPVAAKGLTIKTVRPRWSHFTLITAAPENAVVQVDFNREGKVIDAQILRSSGRGDVDRPLLDAVFNWQASGKALLEIPEAAPDGKPGYVRMTFVMILGR